MGTEPTDISVIQNGWNSKSYTLLKIVILLVVVQLVYSRKLMKQWLFDKIATYAIQFGEWSNLNMDTNSFMDFNIMVVRIC